MRKPISTLILVLVFLSSALAQDDWHTYPFRDLATLMAGEQALYNQTPKADIVVSAKPFPSKTRVTYTGKKRDISEYGRTYIKLWNESRGMPASNADLLVEEFLFLERGTEYWMPVLKGTAQSLEKKGRPGDEVIIYYFYLGGFNPKSLQAKDTSKNPPVPESDGMRWLFAVERVESMGTGFPLMRLDDVVGQSKDLPDKTEDVWFDSRQVKAKVKLIFTGEVREISGKRKQLRDLWFDARGAPAGASELMQSEGLFKEGDKEHWIILRNQTSEHLQAYVKKGDTVYMNTILAGAIKNSGRMELIFMSGEYSTF